MQRRSSAAPARPDSAEVEKALGMHRKLTSRICPSRACTQPGPHELCLMYAGVEFAELDKVLSAYGQPNDPDLPQQWAMYKLGLFTSSHNINGMANAGAWNRWGSPVRSIALPCSGPPG